MKKMQNQFSRASISNCLSVSQEYQKAVIKSYVAGWWNNTQIWLSFHTFHILTWCGVTRSEGVKQRCLYHVLLICLAVSGNTHMSVFILVPSQAPLEGQVIAFWLYLFPSAFHFRYLHQAILPRHTLPLRCCQNLTDWSLNKYIKVRLVYCFAMMKWCYCTGCGRSVQSILILCITLSVMGIIDVHTG